jgi:hypothetical protein
VLVEITEMGAERLMRHLAALEDIYRRMKGSMVRAPPRGTLRDRPS